MSCYVPGSLLGICIVALQWFVPTEGVASEPVSCSLESTRINDVTVDAITREHKDIRGNVDVACVNPSSQFQIVELALVERLEESPIRMSGAIRLELFLDRAMTNRLPTTSLGVEELSPFIVEKSSTLRISIPIYARVSLVRLERAGSHIVGREIELVYRTLYPSRSSRTPSNNVSRGHV